MPLCPQRLDNRIGNRFPTALALGTVPMRMTVNTPSIPIFLHKRCSAIKRVATLCTEKVTGVPFGAASDNDLAFNGRLAALAARGEELVEIKVAVETCGFVGAVVILEARHVVGCGVSGEVGDVLARESGTDARDTFGVLVGRLRVEGYAFEMLAALVAREAFGMEARACC